MKQVAYIATREPSYSRVAIVRSSLHEHFGVTEILSEHPKYVLRMLSVVSKILGCWLTGKLRKQDAIVLGFFAQPIFPLVRFLYRGPIIADAYFSIYNTMVEDKQTTRPGSIVAKLCFWLDRYMLQRSQCCLTDTQTHADYFRTEFNVPEARTERLWISAENEPLETIELQTASQNASQAEWIDGKSDNFQVFFWGGFIPLQGVETIVAAAELVKEKGIEFKIFGTGQTLASCQEQAKYFDTHNLEFCGWQSQEAIRAQAQICHLGLGIFGTTDKANRVIPNKVFEALAMGLPVVTCESEAIGEALTDGENVLLVPPGDPRALAAKILWARDNYAATLRIAANGRERFVDQLSPRQVSKSLANSVNQTLQRFERDNQANAWGALPNPPGQQSEA